MAQVSYALREDSHSMFLLQDAGRHYDKYCQILTFGRYIVRPDFFRQYLYFAPYTGTNGKYRGSVTNVQMSIEDNGYVPKLNYVAVIDSEVEFRVTTSVIRQLSKDHMPAWGVKSYLDYFSDRKSGIIIFLKVYKVNQALSPLYFEKGIRGKSQIFKLYDEQGEEVSLSIDGMEPVISNNKFSYLKDEILHLLKVENVLLAHYDDSENGLNSLQERIVANRHIQGTQERWRNRHLQWTFDDDADEDTDFDMAQLDYELIFNEVLQICPNMKIVIDYARRIKAARLGEYDYHLKEVHLHTDKESKAFSRLFDMSLRSAIRTALYYHKYYGINIEDAFQEACIGVIMAIKKHNENVEGLFPCYVSVWMRRVMIRELEIYNYNCKVPANYYERVSQVFKQIASVFDWSDIQCISHEELYRLLLNYSDCDSDEAYKMAYIIYPSKSIEELINDSHNEIFFAKEDDSLKDVIKSASYKIIYDVLNSLEERERDVIFHRFGFDNNQEEMSLEDVGKKYGITRERVRQIENKAIDKFSKRLRRILDYRDVSLFF
ncbi:sigma-70 family RNA polymerase sigma factor [Succinimonas sp.]|uniref:sigma-70 family RNA polymerase sigma factor n=1 Tax=Succinimonas sp. TaxID=1936151 RepID=UPI0038630A01